MPTSLLTSRQYSRALQSEGDPHTIIRVKNLSTQALVGGSRWGLEEGGRRNEVQPVSVSVSLSLREPFKSAAYGDVVNDSTVNYSTLSKEILKVVASRRPDITHADGFVGLSTDWSLFDLASWIQVYLCGPEQHFRMIKDTSNYIEGGCPCLEQRDSSAYKPPLLDVQKFLEIGVTTFLPKATLLSGGVSLSKTAAYMTQPGPETGISHRSILKIHDVRIPTLIGVNKNERLAKQIVIINVEVDPYICGRDDYYNELEQIIVKTTEESSFETLESLATFLSRRVMKYFIFAYTPFLACPSPLTGVNQQVKCFSQVYISLEKPGAVMFADAPSIEILRNSDPRLDEDAKRLYEEWDRRYQLSGPKAKIPFPLQQSLSSWIEENSMEGDTI